MHSFQFGWLRLKSATPIRSSWAAARQGSQLIRPILTDASGIVTSSSMTSKIDSAGLLILGIETLRAQGLIPITSEAMGESKNVGEARDRQKIGNALTVVVLYSIVVELAIKQLWEDEHGSLARFTHNILELFTELDSDTQEEVTGIYDECCLAYVHAVEAGIKELGESAMRVEIANINEALKWNESAMRNLKYDMTPQGKSVPSGLFWNSELAWVVPSRFPNFAVRLTRWVADLRANQPPS